MSQDIVIPPNLLPTDGRFGSGPSLIRTEQMDELRQCATTVLGTSHRQSGVRHVVGDIREGLRELFAVPDGYEVVLGNGGATAFWDIICCNLITRRAACGVYGSFSAGLADAIRHTPFLHEPIINQAPAGSYTLPQYHPDVDAYCWAHNETSTGVQAPVTRIPGSERQAALTIIDATSAAAALPVNLHEADVYYCSPQKALGSDGGLWLSILSPAAIERANAIAASTRLEGARRWIPGFLSLTDAIAQSRKDQTRNTPAIATLILLRSQLQWLNDHGGLTWAVSRCQRSADTLYQWAERSDYASPFVTDPHARSQAVVTIDLDERLSADTIVRIMQRHGIVDIAGYRKLGRNQLRIGVFPSVDPDNVRALTHCIDYVAERCLDNGNTASHA